MQCNAQRLTEPLSTTFLEMDLLTCEDLRGSDGSNCDPIASQLFLVSSRNPLAFVPDSTSTMLVRYQTLGGEPS